MSDSILTGTNSGDSLDGGSGSDIINSGAGSDTIDGGSGNDRLNAGSGDDILVYVVSENLSVEGTSDLYTGGSGRDTVRLIFTQEEWVNGGQAEVDRYLAHLASVTNPITGEVSNGSASDFTFHFGIPGDSATLTVSMIEKVEWSVPVNTAPALTGTLATLQAGTEDSSYIIHAPVLLQGYTDADEDPLSISGLTADSGTLVDNGNGTWTFTPGENFSGTVTLHYSVIDGVGGSLCAVQSFGVVAVADQPALIVDDASGVRGEAISLVISAGLTDADGSESLSITISGVPNGWTLSAGTLVDPDSGIYVLNSSELVGLSITSPADASPGEINLTVTATATERSNSDAESLSTTISVGISAPEGVEVLSGKVVDGYIAGATVFADGVITNGMLDPGEVSTTTDASGNFVLVGGSGPLVMFGGTDVSTGLAFEGVLRAPDGSTVVTPLTTLIAALVDDGQSVSQATGNVASALGLDILTIEGQPVDLLTLDPVALAVSGGTDGDAAAQVLAAGIQVQNAIVQIDALLAGAGATDASSATVAELANLLGSGSAVDLSSSSTLTTLINNTATTADGIDTSSIDSVVDDAAAVLAAANTEIDLALTGGSGTAVLENLAQVAVIAQGDAVTTELAMAGEQNDSYAGSVATEYTGTNLETQINNAQVGDVDGGLNGTIGNDTLIGSIGNDAIAGLAGNDLLIGNTGNDTLLGGVGRDILRGGPGDDLLNAGTIVHLIAPADYFDLDRVDYSDSTAAVSVNLGAGVATGTDIGTDTLIGFEGVIGSPFDDVLTGGTQAFTEWFVGGAGNDTISGGLLYDRAEYNNATAGISVIMATVPNTNQGMVTGDESVGTDTLIGVEQIVGTNFADTFIATGYLSPSTVGGGLSAFNDFEGMGGDDVITGNGVTRINFPSATASVTVDMAAGTADGDASVGHDVFTGVYSVRGSNFADTFVGGGTGLAEQFEGRGGNDLINGGDDSLNGGLGGGFDTARYGFDGAISVGITVNLAAGTITGDPALTGTDTLRSIEGVMGSVLDDVYDATGFTAYTGDDLTESINHASPFLGAQNQFDGMAGNDAIIGNGETRIGYSFALEGVTVNFVTGTVDGGTSVGHDAFSGVTSVIGSNFDDMFIVGEVSPVAILGLGGTDTVSYASLSFGVDANLSSGHASDAAHYLTFGNGINSIENVIGTNYDDILTGAGAANRLEGGGGNDVVDGGLGNDILIGGPGDDILTGGLGSDIFKWNQGDQGSPATDVVTDFVDAGSVLDLRELLVGETHVGNDPGNLSDYLTFDYSAETNSTMLNVKSAGTAGVVDQLVLLQNYDATAGGTLSTNDIIQNLLNAGKLITDTGS